MAWIGTVTLWCFCIVVLWVLVKLLLRMAQISARLRFIDAKMDALLDDSDIDFMEIFHDRIAMALLEVGKKAAIAECFLSTGWDMDSATGYVEMLADEMESEEEEKDGNGNSVKKRPPHDIGDFNAEEIHRLVDEILPRSAGKSRRKQQK